MKNTMGKFILLFLFTLLFLLCGCGSYKTAEIDIYTRVRERDSLKYDVYFASSITYYETIFRESREICDTIFYRVTLEEIPVLKENFRVFSESVRDNRMEKIERIKKINEKFNR